MRSRSQKEGSKKDLSKRDPTKGRPKEDWEEEGEGWKDGMTVLRERLETQGGHFTRQRAAVFEYLSRVDHHPTAEEVFLAVKAELPRISLATVYKNLEALVACGAASKLTYGDSAARYDIRTDHHYHTHCLKCGRIADLEPETGEQLLELIALPDGFQVEGYRLEISGYCNHCN